jgi:hypothetical protein
MLGLRGYVSRGGAGMNRSVTSPAGPALLVDRWHQRLLARQWTARRKGRWSTKVWPPLSVFAVQTLMHDTLTAGDRWSEQWVEIATKFAVRAGQVSGWLYRPPKDTSQAGPVRLSVSIMLPQAAT